MQENMETRLKELEEENRALKKSLYMSNKLIKETFGPYLTDEVLETIIQSGTELKIGGERRHVTMLFCDLRGSTDLSEQMDASDFIRMLNHFLKEMIEIINAWQGNILDFVGDAIVVIFGAPRENPTSARDAVACAVAMQRRMLHVNEWNRNMGFPELAMGIGIHSGEAIVGNIGSDTRTKYDMIGRDVNLASRIEGCTKGGQILISTETLEAAGDLVITNPAGEQRVLLKGIHEEILIHEVVGFGKTKAPE